MIVSSFSQIFQNSVFEIGINQVFPVNLPGCIPSLIVHTTPKSLWNITEFLKQFAQNDLDCQIKY